jgi:hypothetical protein
MVLDVDASPSQEEIADVLERQSSRIAYWKKWSLYSGLAFVLVVGITSLFLEGMPWHSLWDQIGKYLLLVAFAAMIGALYCVVLLWGAFSQHREFKKIYSPEEK